MRSQILIGISLLFVIKAVGQMTPDFVTTIWVEDAIGNIDSVEVGFDLDATRNIDSEFGEIKIFEPFDSVFEVRAADMGDIDENLSKRIISSTEDFRGCLIESGIFILIQAKYQPVTISWDRQLFFRDECYQGALISNHYADALRDPFIWGLREDEVDICMANEDQFVTYTNEDSIINLRTEIPFVEAEVKSIGLTKVYGVRFLSAPPWGWTPCAYTNTSSPTINETLMVYPNPSTQFIRIQESDKVYAKFSIIDLSGRIVISGDLFDEIDVSELSPGVYFLQLRDKLKNTRITKFLKLE